MKTAPILYTERLILRSFTLEDAADVRRLTSDPDVASATYSIEHPYEEGMAEAWIQWCHEEFEKSERVNFAVTLRTDGTLIGKIGLTFGMHYAEYIPKDPERYFFEDTIRYRILKSEFVEK